jgi:anti-sigma-K factor RskA
MRPANATLRFLLELSALAAVAYWGWSEHSGVWRWVLVVAAPLAVAILWGYTVAPKAKRRVGDPWRLVVELLVFGGAFAALLDADQPLLAIIFGLAIALHLALTFPLGQREPGVQHVWN